MSDSSSSPQARRDRRSYGLRGLGSSLSAVTKRAFARRGLTGADIARQWPAIVGQELASHCRPRQLRFPKSAARGGSAIDGRLTLRVAPGWALEVQHLEPLMLERINSFFGYRAVAKLVLQQGPLPPLRDGAPESRGRHRKGGAAAPPAPLDPAAEASLAAKLSTVDDPDLREALERIARRLREKRDRPIERP